MGYKFSEAKKNQNKFTPLPESRYNVKAIKAEKRISGPGNDMASVTFVVGDQGDYNGRKLFDNLVFTDNALWKILSLFEAAGASDLLTDDREIDDIIQDIPGLTANVFVEVDEDRNKLSLYKAIPESEKATLAFDGDLEFPVAEETPAETEEDADFR